MNYHPSIARRILLATLAAACGDDGGNGTGSESTGDGTTGTAGTTAPTTGDIPPSASPVRLNEVTSKSAIEGPYAGLGDAIELHNPGDAVVDLSGWKLSDDPNLAADKTYEFPAGTALAAGGYLVLVAFDNMTGEGDFPFGLSSSAVETVSLVDADGALVDQVEVDGTLAEISYCRVPDASGDWAMCDQTLGATNKPASSTCGDGVVEGAEVCDSTDVGGQTCADLGLMTGDLTCSATCKLDPNACESGLEVAINELEAIEDRIELYNAGAADADIGGWILTDKYTGAGYDAYADLEKLKFVPGTSLTPGQFLIITKGDTVTQHPFGLGSDGDTVTLLTADLTVVDVVRYEAEQAEISFCSLSDGPGGTWTADCIPTFGLPNEAP